MHTARIVCVCVYIKYNLQHVPLQIEYNCKHAKLKKKAKLN